MTVQILATYSTMGFSRVPAIYPNPSYFTLSILKCDRFSGLWKSVHCISLKTCIDVYLYLIYLNINDCTPCLVKLWIDVQGGGGTSFLLVTLKISLRLTHFGCRFSGTIGFAHDPLPSLQTTDGFSGVFYHLQKKIPTLLVPRSHMSPGSWPSSFAFI